MSGNELRGMVDDDGATGSEWSADSYPVLSVPDADAAAAAGAVCVTVFVANAANIHVF